MPSNARATLSNTAMINPNTVVTIRYDRVLRAKLRRATEMCGRSPPISVSRTSIPVASMLKNSSSANRNTRLVVSPVRSRTIDPTYGTILPKSRPDKASRTSLGETPNRPSTTETSCTMPSTRSAYRGSVVASWAIDTNATMATATSVPYTSRTITSVAAQLGNPMRRNRLCAGLTTITMIRASRIGVISQAADISPATVITADAVPSSRTSARGMPAVKTDRPFRCRAPRSPRSPPRTARSRWWTRPGRRG